MATKSLTAYRTTEELRTAALDGDQVDPAELAAAQAAEELAELQAEGARRRSAEQAEQQRQAGLAQLRTDVDAFAADTEQVVALAEKAVEAVAAFRDATAAHHRRVAAFATRAGELGVPGAGHGTVPTPGADGVAHRRDVGGEATVVLAGEDGSTRRLQANEPDRATYVLLGEIISRLELPARLEGEMASVRKMQPGSTARKLRALDRTIAPRDDVEVINRSGKRVKLGRREAEHAVERLGFHWPSDGPSAA